jgi:alkylation response protein AidB-like acyl-CoA dehydrogenase
MHEAVQKIQASAQVLREEHAPSDRAGKLTERAAAALRDSGGIRLLQSKEHGGYQADLTDFFAWVRTVAQYNPSAGWVSGVVGVHPWQIALCDAKLQTEIYGDDVDTWVASPYAPIGRAKPVDGGYVFSGEWPYSTGTDFCDWVVLGGIVTDADGEVPMPPEIRHFFLPRSDYEIVEGSWNVMGLMGTGSKNVRVTNAFVPHYRTVGQVPLCEGEYNRNQPDAPLYHLPFGGVFSAAICSATFGIARGTLDAYRSQLPTRMSVTGVAGTRDPFQQTALAEAEADLAAGIVHLDVMIVAMQEHVARGNPLTLDMRLDFRRNQVRAIQRVLRSVDHLLSRAGSAAVWSTKPVERYWRDLRTAATHVCNVTDVIYTAWANHEFQLGDAVNALY